MQNMFSGKVVRGDGYGRKIGFPTVNLDIGEVGLPASGVYFGFAILGDNNYKAGIVINKDKKIEAHLIGYSGDAYGKIVTLKIEKFLREFKNFDTEKELVEQITKDIEICSQE
ncbi:riboflavin kinase [Candidatus Nomurabacteria bacterium]|nr:riboflavin kinase [Candidatus Nomurabacteria bacterium]